MPKSEQQSPVADILHFRQHKRKNIEDTDAYKMLSILYGLVTFIGGVAFSISHAIIPEDEAEHIKHFAEIYFTYLYSVSVCWILFCIIDISRHQRKMNPIKSSIVEDELANRLSLKRVRNSLRHRTSATAPSFNVQMFDDSDESSQSGSNEQRDEDDQNNLFDVQSEDNQQEAIEQLTPNNSSEDLTRGMPVQSRRTIDQTRDFLTRRHALDPGGVSNLKMFIRHRRSSIAQRKLGYSYDDHSTAGGLYTRVGIGIFCLGTAIQSGLSILSNLENLPCVRWTAVMDDSSRLMFCFIQFFFIFKHSNLIIQAHESVARIAVMHVVVTNLCVWFRMVVVETKSQIIEMNIHEATPNELRDLNHVLHASKTHQPSTNCTHVTNVTLQMTAFIQEGYMKLKPLLYPCTIEFSLMCLTLFFLIWENIGKKFTYKMSDKASTKNVFMINCQASIKGLFSGMIIFSSTVISVILYAVFRNKIGDDSHSSVLTSNILPPKISQEHFHQSKLSTLTRRAATPSSLVDHHEGSQISSSHQYTVPGLGPFISIADTPKRLLYSIAIIEIVNLVLLSISLVATTWAMIKIRKLHYRRTTARFDDVLIIVSLTGTYLYTVFSAFALLNNKHQLTWIAYLKIVIVILEFAESTLHAFFILLALRKRLQKTHRHMYPAREVITLLIMLDLSLWFEETTTTTKHEANPFQLAFYHIIPWSIIAAIATPLQIFFRFHASVCLSHIWENMYILPKYEPVAPHGL